MSNIKKVSFEIDWEIVIVNGIPYLLLKDLLKYFGYATSSQGSVIDQVSNKNKIMLSGENARGLTHISGRGWIINRQGLGEYVRTKKGTDKYSKGVKLVNWMLDVKDGIKHGIPVPGEVLVSTPEKDPDLFDVAKDQELADLKNIVHLQSERMDRMDRKMNQMQMELDQLKKSQMASMIHQEGEKKLIDASALISFLESQRK